MGAYLVRYRRWLATRRLVACPMDRPQRAAGSPAERAPPADRAKVGLGMVAADLARAREAVLVRTRMAGWEKSRAAGTTNDLKKPKKKSVENMKAAARRNRGRKNRRRHSTNMRFQWGIHPARISEGAGSRSGHRYVLCRLYSRKTSQWRIVRKDTCSNG